MREIQASVITDTIERLCIEANQVLPDDIKKSIQACRASEDGQIACGILDNIIENYQIAENEQVPICQDTGMACVFLEIGQDVHIAGGDLTEAVNEGVRRGYTNGYLRKSVVKDPVRRGNTGDNTPAMLYTEIVPGENIKITVGPKGFGSENMSAIRMFKRLPASRESRILSLKQSKQPDRTHVHRWLLALESEELLIKLPFLLRKPLMRPVDSENEDPYYADLGERNAREDQPAWDRSTGIWRKETAIGLNIETMPTHIAGMAMCDQHQLPRNTAQNGGDLRWNVILHYHLPKNLRGHSMQVTPFI